MPDTTAALMWTRESVRACLPRALTRRMQGRTSIVIAHRLSTIRHADVIFVIKDCALAEQGTHDELVSSNGVYADLYRLQAPDDEPLVTPAAAAPR